MLGGFEPPTSWVRSGLVVRQALLEPASLQGSLKGVSWTLRLAVSRQRIVARAGRAEEATLVAVREWLGDFLEP